MVISSISWSKIRGKIDAGAPEDLAKVVPDRERIGIVSRDSAHLRADGEGDLHHLVQRRLIAGGAERALVVLLVHVSQGRSRVEHAAAAGTQDIPRQLENANARGVQERGDHSLFVQAALRCEIEDVDAAKFVIRRVPDQCFHGSDRFRVGRLSHDAEQALGARFAHGAKSTSKSGGEKPVLFGSGCHGCGRRDIAMRSRPSPCGRAATVCARSGVPLTNRSIAAAAANCGPEKQKLPSPTTETTGKSGKGRKCVVPFMVCITLVDVPGREAVKVERS